MNDRDDIALAERDQAIAGLRFALDGHLVAEEVGRARPDLGVVTAEPNYVRYKPATSCIVGYRFTTEAGSWFPAYVRAVARPGLPKLDGLVRAAQRSNHDRDVLAVEHLHALISLFPVDAEIPTLATLNGPQRARLLRKMLPAHPELWEATLTHLRYKPERRYVARLEAGPHSAVLKAYVPSDRRTVEAASRASKRIGGDVNVPAAARLGRSYRHGVVVLEWLNGETLATALRDGSASSSNCAAAGTLLARLHAADPRRIPGGPTPDWIRVLGAACRAVDALAPDVSREARVLATDVARRIARLPPSIARVHGDFAPDQVVLTATGAAVIDLDRAGRGPPAFDVGGFRAAKCLLGRAAPTATDHDRAFLDAYAHASGDVLPAGIEAFTAFGLLARIAEPFRRRQSGWRDGIEQILDRARAELAHA